MDGNSHLTAPTVSTDITGRNGQLIVIHNLFSSMYITIYVPIDAHCMSADPRVCRY